MGQGDTLLNAVIGAVVSFVLSFIPLSPVLGGVAAGYLQKGDRSDGAKVGALSGAIALLPLALLGFLLVFFFGIAGGIRGFGGALVLFFFIMIFAGAYGVILGGIGGYIGAYLVEEDVV